jgi:hypothetical protein
VGDLALSRSTGTQSSLTSEMAQWIHHSLYSSFLSLLCVDSERDEKGAKSSGGAKGKEPRFMKIITRMKFQSKWLNKQTMHFQY